MSDLSGSLLDKAFFLIAFFIVGFVAISPDGFIRVITFGRSNSTDVSRLMLRTTQIIAGFAVLAMAISFVVSFLTKTK